MFRKFTFLFSLLPFLCFNQVDFNNYQPIQSKGKTPELFSSHILDKIEVELKNDYDLSKKEKKDFVTQRNYSLDSLLHYGYVIYGDELSTYIQDLAQVLLKDEPELFSELNFFVLKSNVSNAFITPNGSTFFSPQD